MTESKDTRIDPVESFKDAAPLLRRPFTADAVKFKVQVAYPKDDPTGGLIVAYIDARLVAERLNLVCPHLWSEDFEPKGDLLLCELTVDGIIHRDVGEGYKGKGLYSDAFKRAAVKFGVGVSLYAIPAIQLTLQSGDLRQTTSGSKKSAAITVKGEGACRYRYRQWLAETGVSRFGEPLDHGDMAESVGDVEAGEPEIDEAPAAIGKDIATKIVNRIWNANGAKSQLQLAASHVAGSDVGDVSTKTKAVAAVGTLNFAQAEKLDRWTAKKEKEADR